MSIGQDGDYFDHVEKAVHVASPKKIEAQYNWTRLINYAVGGVTRTGWEIIDGDLRIIVSVVDNKVDECC